MSAKVPCGYCGLPFVPSGRPVDGPRYCCTGCAMAARIPVDADGQFPVNGALIQALAAGFVFFNQALFAGLGALLLRQGNLVTGQRFEWISYGAGVALGLGLALALVTSRAARAFDYVLFVAAAAVYVLSWRVLPPSTVCVLAANALLLAGVTRGVWLKRLRKF